MHLGAIILINYNTSKLSLQAIQSIIEHTPNFDDFQLVVVDNASETIDFAELKKGIEKLDRKNIKLVRSRINTGFGGGNMLGVQNAIAEFYIFVNSDVLLKEDSFNILIHFLRNNKDAAMVGAQPEDENGKNYKAFDYPLSLQKELLSDNLNHLLNPRKFPNRKKTFTKPTRVGAIPGSLMVCSATNFDGVGGFDTNLFLYYEEKDICFRLAKLGKATYTFPGTTYTHLKGKSTSSSYATKKELKISQFYCVRKNLGNFQYVFFYIFCFIKFFLKAFFSPKNRKYLVLLFNGVSLAQSLKHQQKIKTL